MKTLLHTVNTLYARTLVLLAALLLAGAQAQAADRGEQKQVFGDYEVHYIGLTSSFLAPDVAKAYGIERSRALGFLSISVLKRGKAGELATPVPAKLSGQLRNLIGQKNALEFREIKETGAVYYVSTFRFDDEDMYHVNLQVTPQGQSRTYDVKFSQKFYQE